MLEDRGTGEQWPLEPGVLYCVGPTDRHRITRNPDEGMRIISVFNPPIIGEETHDEDGAYPPTGEIPPGQPRMFVKTVEDVRNAGTGTRARGRCAISTRYLTAADNLGFSLHGVRLRAGASMELWYKHHWEANLILEGTLDVTDHASGETLSSRPRRSLSRRCRATAIAIETVDGVHLISVFNPPLTGSRTSRRGRRLSADGTDSTGSRPGRRALPARTADRRRSARNRDT